MKKKPLVILAVVTVLVIGGIFAVAQRARHHAFGKPGMHGRGVMTALRALDLTDDQKAKVKEILEANKSTVQPIRKQMKANHQKLADLKGSFDEAAVTEIAKNQGDLTAQMIVARQRVKSEIFAILTDEQKAKAEQLRNSMLNRFKDRMKHFRGGDPEASEE
jgi:protein CpxP